MTAEEAVAFYHSLERFGIRPGLERIAALCKKLGDPQDSFRCVHVAGTNGKGSTCTEIASVLTHAGYKTGLYTSPYVIDFRERIRLNGEMISSEMLARVTEKVKRAVEELAAEDIFVTEFEAVTAAAFLYYAGAGCEIAVLETGLGGRFDATNVIKDPLCCVITSISLDHTKILGDTTAAIAGEKCGIIKPNAPVITNISQEYPVLSVIKQHAWKNTSELHIVSRGCFEILGEEITGTQVRYKNTEMRIPFPGAHQLENASLALCVIELLRDHGYRIGEEDIAAGIGLARIPARTEVISYDPLVILDGSHNDGSTAALAAALDKFLSGKRLIAVMGMMADKDCGKALNNLLPYFTKVIAVTPSNPRAMKAEAFKNLVEYSGCECEAYDSPAEGIAQAYKQLAGYDALIVCGSLYLASDVRELLLEYKQ